MAFFLWVVFVKSIAAGSGRIGSHKIISETHKVKRFIIVGTVVTKHFSRHDTTMKQPMLKSVLWLNGPSSGEPLLEWRHQSTYRLVGLASYHFSYRTGNDRTMDVSKAVDQWMQSNFTQWINHCLFSVPHWVIFYVFTRTRSGELGT